MKTLYNKFDWAQIDVKSSPEGLRHCESLAPGFEVNFHIKEVCCKGETKFQKYTIIDTAHFGKVLVIDNLIQSAESDEAIYHESLVHPAMLSHPCPKTVFIGGGGEGATLREVLRHKSVEKVVMCDIDGDLINICRKWLPSWHQGLFDDKRVDLVIGDAKAYLEDSARKFDVIIMDICDPIEEGPGWKLYTSDFYKAVAENNMTSSESVLATQSTAVSVNLIRECFTVINHTLNQVFSEVIPYRCSVPSFGVDWGYNICCNTPKQCLNSQTSFVEIDSRLRERLASPSSNVANGSKNATSENDLKHYDGECHAHMFNLCKYERQAIEAEKRILSLDNPLFLFYGNVITV